MDEITKELARIGKAVEMQNEILLERMGGPKSRFAGILEFIVLIVGALTFLNVADVVVGWVRGG
ncbi:MAG: hypothetical protein FWD94_06425 [Treponema sp.]|nr:hypothetical protein [Treponema sp.]